MNANAPAMLAATPSLLRQSNMLPFLFPEIKMHQDTWAIILLTLECLDTWRRKDRKRWGGRSREWSNIDNSKDGEIQS